MKIPILKRSTTHICHFKRGKENVLEQEKDDCENNRHMMGDRMSYFLLILYFLIFPASVWRFLLHLALLN